jgi:hypothetical protein
MHPLWQIKQVVKIDNDNKYTVDWHKNYGNLTAGDLWGAFFALVIWIAIHVKHLTDLFAYVNDSFSWELEGNFLHYAPYNKLLPAKQVHLLELWDEIGICHNKRKQEWGPQFTIIGLEVDANAMTITMPAKSHANLLDAICAFAITGTQHSLCKLQKLRGWINWALNAWPLLHPSLCHLYAKISGKQQTHAKLWVNQELIGELLWLARHISNSNGIFILDSIDWPLATMNKALFTDASGTGMGY